MLFVFTTYKIIKLIMKMFVKVFIKLPIRIIKLVAGVAGSDNNKARDDLDGFSEGDTRGTERTGSVSDNTAAESTQADSGGATAAGTGGSTPQSASIGGGPQPKGALDTLKWAFEFLTRRTEIILPLAALGVLQVLISGATFLGLPPGIATLGSILYLLASVFVAGIVIFAAADDIGGEWRSNAEYADRAADRFLPALATAIILGIAVAIGLLLLVLPGLYLFVRFGFALPAVFAGGYGVIESIKESWERTGDYQLTVAGIFAATFLFGLLQFIPIIGPFVVTVVGTPLAMGSMTYLFLVTESGGGQRTEPAPAPEPETAEPAASTGTANTGAEPAGGAPTGKANGSTEGSGGDWSPDGTAADTSSSQTTEVADSRSSSAGTDGAEAADTADPAAEGADVPGRSFDDDSSTAATTSEEETDADVESGDDTENEEYASDGTDASDAAATDETVTLPDDETERITRLIDEIESGEAGPERFDPLVDLLDSDSTGVRREAAAALGTLGARYPEAADEAIEALQDCRLDPDIGVSDAASDSVREIKDAR